MRTVFRMSLLLVLCAAALPLGAQTKGVPGTHTRSAVVNFRELARAQAQTPARRREPKATHAPMPGPGKLRVPAGVRATPGPAPAPQAAAVPVPLVDSPAPTKNFVALPDSNTSIPPDTHGAVGPNHLMVVLNTDVAIQDRNGNYIGGAVPLNSFWNSLGSPDAFDPKVLYDHINGRWIFTAMSDSADAASSILIGASQTDDPTGTWNLFRIDADATDTNWADYPSMGFNKDWVAVSVNFFANSNNVFVNHKIYVFKSADLYKLVSPASTHTLITVAQGFTLVPAITHDPDLTTLYVIDEGWFDSISGTDFIRISKITGTVGSEVLTEGLVFAGTTGVSWNGSADNNRSDSAPQLNTTNKIQNNDSRIQNVVYRDGSLWTTQNVFIPTATPLARTAVQWWEVQEPAPGDPLGATVAPLQRGRIEDANFFYAFPSIAVNKNKDVLIGFSRFSANQFAGANYAFRAGTDAANTMRTDVEFKVGEATYFKTFGGSRNRWGDYSNTVVDPLNDTDFWTIQEYAETPPGDGFDRWGTQWAQVVPPGAAVKKREGQTVSE